MPALHALPPSDQEYSLHFEQKQLRSYWYYYVDKGKEHSAQNKPSLAARQFSECVRIAKLLLHSNDSSQQEKIGNELLFLSLHNLVACYNLLNRSSQGELGFFAMPTSLI